MNKIDLVQVAQKSLNIEIAALTKLKDELDSTIAEVIETIDRMDGRLIITGIGKSALVAQKMVATFNSTGCPSLFMHAADAVHGDLGMTMEGDVVIAISKSGETSEIKVLLPILRQRGNTLIGITSNKESSLARSADFLLYVPVDQEADPNNLAPTASTTAQMALGDAIAIGLLALKGFTPADFAQFHPGGSLGKQLYLKVQDLAENNAVPSIQLDSGIRETIIEISSKRLGIAVVLDTDKNICGVITDGDLRRMLESENDVSDLRASDIMSTNPYTIEQDEYAIKALEIMRSHSITQLVVTDNKAYTGIIHLHDLLNEGLI